MTPVDSRKCRNVVDVKKVDILSVIVQNGAVKLVENQLIDDTNVVQEYPRPKENDVDVVSIGRIEVL